MNLYIIYKSYFLSHKFIKLLKIKNLLITAYPKFLCPYLIMEIKKIILMTQLSFLFLSSFYLRKK